MKLTTYTLLIIFLMLSGIYWCAIQFRTSVSTFVPGQGNEKTYNYPWPGILPDQKVLYKLKVLRNKVISKIIYSDVKRVEFDLLMADKTLYSAKLLMEKGNTELAKDTALKGENYFSILVSDYNNVSRQIPVWLDGKIDLAYLAHQILIQELFDKAPEKDKNVYKEIDYFSNVNYAFIQKIRNDRMLK